MSKQIGAIKAKTLFGSLLSDITIATVKAKAEGKQYGFERYEAARLQGRIDKVKVSPNQNDPEKNDVCLSGEFVATNVITGEIYSSGTLYPMGTGMSGVMANAKENALFAMRVFIAPSQRTAQGYTFDFESVLEVQPSEAVARLSDAFLALPAPKPEEKPKASGKAK